MKPLVSSSKVGHQLPDLFGALNTWQVTGEPGAVGPLQDVRPQALKNKGGTGTGTRLILQHGLYPFLHLPGESGQQTGNREDGVRVRGSLFPLSQTGATGILV